MLPNHGAYSSVLPFLPLHPLALSLALSDDDSAPPLSPLSDDELMALFGPEIPSPRLGDPFFLFVERLLGIINLNRSSSSEGASLAFNILLGLLPLSKWPSVNPCLCQRPWLS